MTRYNYRPPMSLTPNMLATLKWIAQSPDMMRTDQEVKETRTNIRTLGALQKRGLIAYVGPTGRMTWAVNNEGRDYLKQVEFDEFYAGPLTDEWLDNFYAESDDQTVEPVEPITEQPAVEPIRNTITLANIGEYAVVTSYTCAAPNDRALAIYRKLVEYGAIKHGWKISIIDDVDDVLNALDEDWQRRLCVWEAAEGWSYVGTIYKPDPQDLIDLHHPTGNQLLDNLLELHHELHADELQPTMGGDLETIKALLSQEGTPGQIVYSGSTVRWTHHCPRETVSDAVNNPDLDKLGHTGVAMYSTDCLITHEPMWEVLFDIESDDDSLIYCYADELEVIPPAPIPPDDEYETIPVPATVDDDDDGDTPHWWYEADDDDDTPPYGEDEYTGDIACRVRTRYQNDVGKALLAHGVDIPESARISRWVADTTPAEKIISFYERIGQPFPEGAA